MTKEEIMLLAYADPSRSYSGSRPGVEHLVYYEFARNCARNGVPLNECLANAFTYCQVIVADVMLHRIKRVREQHDFYNAAFGAAASPVTEEEAALKRAAAEKEARHRAVADYWRFVPDNPDAEQARRGRCGIPDSPVASKGVGYRRAALRLIPQIKRVGQSGSPLEMFCQIDSYEGVTRKARPMVWTCTGGIRHPMRPEDYDLLAQMRSEPFERWETPESLRGPITPFRWAREYH